MSSASQGLRETRSETIFRHTRQMLHELRLSMGTFSVEVVDRYHALVPPAARTLHFKTEGDPFRCQATNAQRLARYMDADTDTRLPVDLEEAWVGALREPYRSACKVDLVRRYGSLFVQLADAAEGGSTDPEAISIVTQEFARMLSSVAPTMNDQVIDARDWPHIPRVIADIDALIGGATALRARYARALMER